MNHRIVVLPGDGIGPEVVGSAKEVLAAAGAEIEWVELEAGRAALEQYGTPLPDHVLRTIREVGVALKGPITTPIGEGFSSVNVALRKQLNLYANVRPIDSRYGISEKFTGVDMVIFRENTEDIYAGVEWEANSDEAKRVIKYLQRQMGVKKIRFPATSAIGIKPVSIEGSERLIRKAIQYAIDNNRRSVTLVHKGNIMKFTEGGFKKWGYELAAREFGAKLIGEGPWMELPNGIVIKDVIADAFLQQILLRPDEYDVIATLNLNGDYISDALAAEVGGIGIAPGANLSDTVAMFEATHGTAPKYAGKDYVNPGSLILSAEMMLRHLGWVEAADLIVASMEKAIAAKTVTYDFARLMDGATEVKCSAFAEAMVAKM